MKAFPFCIGCCTIIIPQPDVTPYCIDCIQGNEDIAADYHRIIDEQQPIGPFGVRLVFNPIWIKEEEW